MTEVEDITRQLEQAIDQLPRRWFSYTYSDSPNGLRVTLWHEGNIWCGEIRGINNKTGVYRAPTFADLYGTKVLGIAGWLLVNQQELLDAARNMKDQQDSPLP